jgi:hypothetical protein
MRLRPRKHSVAALVLAAALACGPMLLSMSNASAVGAAIDVSAKYGCGLPGTDGAFVEVTVRDPNPTTSDYEIGLMSGTDGVPTTFPDGEGPTLVSAGGDIDKVTVRLAQAVGPGDNAYVKNTGTGTVTPVDLSSYCSNISTTVPALDTPLVAGAEKVSTNDCLNPIPAGKQAVSATIYNPNDPDRNYTRLTGLDTVPYTVLLVNAANDKKVDGQSLVFAKEDTLPVCLAAPPNVTATYKVRAIGVDGSSTDATSTVRVVAPTTSHPSPSPTPKPKPTPKPTPKPSAPTVVRTSPATTSTPAQSPPSNSDVVTGPGQPGASQFGDGGSSTSSSAAGSSSNSGTPRATGSSARPSASAVVSLPNPDGTVAVKHLAEPPLDSSSKIFVWQRDAALIVLIDALAISALIGGVVWSAKRR